MDETPSCQKINVQISPEKHQHHVHKPMVEALQGVELEFSGLEMAFLKHVGKADYCSIKLNDKTYATLLYAVKNNYWYQMYIDDLPVWGIVGDVEEGDDGQKQYYVWTHKKLNIGYNGDQIVDINLTSDGKVERLYNAAGDDQEGMRLIFDMTLFFFVIVILLAIVEGERVTCV